MAVDEQVQRGWTRLTGKTCDHPGHVLLSGDRRCAGQTPDPATQPWEWVKALAKISHVMLCPPLKALDGYEQAGWRLAVGDSFTGFGNTPEAALEAAIRAWEAAHVN